MPLDEFALAFNPHIQTIQQIISTVYIHKHPTILTQLLFVRQVRQVHTNGQYKQTVSEICMLPSLLKNGGRIIGFFALPWWTKPIRKVLKDKFTMASSIMPDTGGDRSVSDNKRRFMGDPPTFYSLNNENDSFEFLLIISNWTTVEIDGRKSICDQKDNSPGYAGYSPPNGQCITIEIHTTSRW